MTVGDLLAEAIETLRAAGLDNPRLEARVLLGAVIDGGEAVVFGYPERDMPDAQVRRIRDLVARRAAREPLSQVLGEKEFWSLAFEVTGDTLTPRPDTETLIEAALEQLARMDNPTPRILDLGTGSGCILLTLLHSVEGASGLGVDISEKALAVARRNAARLDLQDRARFQSGDWTAGIGDRFDLVVSNPPYIPTGDIGALDPEVARFEPLVALDGGQDGLDAYRTIAKAVRSVLAPGGTVCLEVGAGQAAAVAELLRQAGLDEISIHEDLGRINRCVRAVSPD